MLKKFTCFITLIFSALFLTLNVFAVKPVYNGATTVQSNQFCAPGDLYLAYVYGSGYGEPEYSAINTLKSKSEISVQQTKWLYDDAEYTRVLNAYGIEATSNLKSILQTKSFRGSGSYYYVLLTK